MRALDCGEFTRIVECLNGIDARASWWSLLQWRVEAFRRGKSFAEIAAARTLIYRVEQLFLVHRGTGRWLLHIAAEPAIADDSASLTGLLTETEEFTRDAFFAGRESALEEFFVGEKRVWIAAGREAYLAAVIAGDPPDDLKKTLEEAIQRIHREYASALAEFSGNSSAFAKAASLLSGCLRAEYRPVPQLDRLKIPRLQLPRLSRPRVSIPRVQLPRLSLPRVRLPRLSIVLPIVVAAVAILLVVVRFTRRSELRWQDFVQRLKAEPGLLIADTEWHWLTPSRVAGLRDALAKDPAGIAREAKVNPERLRFEWKEYVATDSVMVQRRFAQRFGVPREAKISVDGETVEVSGRVPNDWLERVRQEGTQVAGVKSIVERDIVPVYDASRVLAQFKAQFSPPPSVRASLVNSTLVLAGRAPFEWLTPVRDGARKIPGITAINGDDLVVEFDPKQVVERFREQFGLPVGVNASVQGGRLVITGEAPHAWLDQVRRGAVRLAGVRVLDDRNVLDIDQREFEQTKAHIDASSILFILNRDTISPEANLALVRLGEEVRRCFAAARNLGVNVNLEVRGYGDAVASDTANAELSKRRAEAVRNALVSAELDERKIVALGLGTPPPPGPWEKAGAGQFDRRVFFKVAIRP